MFPAAFTNFDQLLCGEPCMRGQNEPMIDVELRDEAARTGKAVGVPERTRL